MANNQYNFLDYAGLSLFWNNVKSIIEKNESATTTSLTNLDTKIDNVESSKADKVHAHTSVLDVNRSSATTFAYSKGGMNYGDYSWLAGWNGYELRAVDKTQFAQASHTHAYLPLAGGTMDSGASIKWPATQSPTWDTFGLQANTGLQILNTIGAPSTNAPSDYSVGLSVSGYYGFCLAYYGGGNDWWLKGNGDEEWKTVIHSGNIGRQSVSYATTAGSAKASDVKEWAKADTKPPYTGTEVTLSGYSKNNSYKPIESGDSVQAAIAKLEGAISGLEALLASI